MVYIRGVIINAGPEALKRGMGPVVKQGLGNTVLFWHRRFMPKHFRSGAAARYRYKRRSAKYIARKQRVKGFVAPLTWSGRFRKLAGMPIVPRGSSKRMRGTMATPWYAGMVPKKRNAPSLGGELIAVANSEEQALAAHLAQEIQTGLHRVRSHRKVRV